MARAAAALGAALAIGCGPADRPDASGEVAEMAAPAPAPASAPAGEQPASDGSPCEPASLEECRIYYIDEDGRMQCPMSYRVCRLDGSGFYPCGEYRIGADGTPVKVTSSRDGG